MSEAINTVTTLIPHRPPFLFIDEIISDTSSTLTAKRTWRPDEYFYQGHYPNAPITPGVILCECVFQAGALLMAKTSTNTEGSPLIAKINEARFRLPVYPGDTVTIEVQKSETLAGFTMMTGTMKNAANQRILTISFSVAWKSPAQA